MRDSAVRALRDSLGLSWEASRRRTVAAGLLQLGGAISGLVIVLASKLTIDGLLSGTGATSTLTLGLVLLVVASSIAGTIGTFQQQQQRVLGESVTQILWKRVLRVCGYVDLVTWETTEFVSRLDRVRYNALQAPSAAMNALFGAAGGVVGTAVLTVGLASISPLLIPVLLLSGIPVLALSRVASRAEFRFVNDTNDVQRSRLYLKQLLTGRQFAAEVRAFDASTHLLGRHRSDDQSYLAALRRQAGLRQRLGLLAAATSAVSLAITFGLIVLLVRRDSLSLAEAGAAAVAARLLAGQLSTIFTSASAFIETAPFIEDMRTFLDAAPVPGVVEGAPRGLNTAVELSGVSFTYPGSSRPAVSGASIRVPRGAVVALVGENGSGKTTLAKLLGGLFSPDEGDIRWDGAALDAADLRASCSVLFQDFVHYQMTAAENVSMSEPESVPDIGRVVSATTRARVHDTVGRLEEGYATMLGVELAEGADLSGGEWQRLALARALFRERDLVVLDEPSAALDPRAEHELFSDVRSVLRGQSALLISHRYSSVRLADYIYVLDRGEILEQGTHDELVAAGGRYAELFALQAATYLAEQ